MARRRSSLTLLTTAEDEFQQIITWYEGQLERAFPPADLQWEPIKLGPTWQWSNGWVLPQHSLGWRILAWCGHWLRDRKGHPWQFTPEQTRFILWYFAVDETGTFLYHSAVLQRLKGWGKDPVAACLSIAAMFGEVVFDHFDGDRAVGREQPTAWVQIVAVSITQTQNTMKLFPSLVSREAQAHYGIQIGKRNVWGLNDTRQIEAVTSSPMAIEGGRPTLIVRNETQNWNSSNSGHDMAGAIEGNAAKAEVDSPARMLDLCNAYRPGEDSVGQRTREAWESTQGSSPEFVDYGLMYDSLEAPPKAPLTVDSVVDVVKAVRGDAIWLDAAGRIAKSIANPLNTPSESRRKWYNQVRAAEDAWTDTDELDPLKAPDKVVEPGEEIVMFLDCSKSDDATGLVGVRMSDGHVFTIDMWQRPPGKRGDGWVVPRERVDEAVEATFSTYRVVGFFGDPSHSLEDESASSYWMPLFDKWHRLYKTRLRIWASGSRKTGTGHAVMFDMADRSNTVAFAEAVGVTLQEMKDGAFTFDGDARLRRHILNARRYPVAGYVSIGKEHRESKRKIDLAVCMVGARMVRRRILNTKKKRGGQLW